MYPYWCNFCEARFRDKDKYHRHWLMHKKQQNDALSAVAPVNREQKRKMAKKAGQIKDWKHLNAP